MTLVHLKSLKSNAACHIHPASLLLFRGVCTRSKLGNTDSSMIQRSLISSACASKTLRQQAPAVKTRNPPSSDSLYQLQSADSSNCSGVSGSKGGSVPVRGVIAGGGGNCLGRVDMGGTRKRNALGGGGASVAGRVGS